VTNRRTLSLYRNTKLRTQAHTRLRWWWCPFPVIEAEVPLRGDVLEVGCGHGVLSLYLALARPGRHVVGVDIDMFKVRAAAVAAGQLHEGEADVDFETVEPGYVPTGKGDAIVFADMLYLLPEAEQKSLLLAAAAALRPGGRMVVKEMGTAPQWKARWNSFQETLATKVFAITDSTGDGLSFVAPVQMEQWLRDAGLDVTGRAVDHGYPWPHYLIVASASTNESTSSSEL
jgi:2-polyprenyl-3-methyl-5-hydroxy-6-metoxy-1,4-benzoquinol methylase